MAKQAQGIAKEEWIVAASSTRMETTKVCWEPEKWTKKISASCVIGIAEGRKKMALILLQNRIVIGGFTGHMWEEGKWKRKKILAPSQSYLVLTQILILDKERGGEKKTLKWKVEGK